MRVKDQDEIPVDEGWDDHDTAPPKGAITIPSPMGNYPGAGFPTHGARPHADESGTTFRVFAPEVSRVELVTYRVDPAEPTTPAELMRIRMTPHADGFHAATVQGVGQGTLYRFIVDGRGPFPDPASRSQPFGVHGPSEVVALDSLVWTDETWRGCPAEQLVIYELHVGTFTPQGTFRGCIERLPYLRSLGVTAIELLPIADFPGQRNWGYDGVALYAPARCYGTVADLAALVDAAHASGLAVMLDVVYNHLGPDGNYLAQFAPYFTEKSRTPWGEGFDFDGPRSQPIRNLILENAAYWIRDLHVDGLRLDSTHAIVDDSVLHIVTEIADVARASASHREVHVIAEDGRNEARLVREVAHGGYGLDGVWADDFHYSVQRLLAGDDEGFYGDFRGAVGEVAKIVQRGWLFEGQHSRHVGGPRGTPAFDVLPPRVVHSLQNHDTVGNRPRGDRLHTRVDSSRYKAATALLLATPYTPLLFMGQEFAASTPFPFFCDHHEELGDKVRQGRLEEFKHFRAFAEEAARGGIPDPQAESTWLSAKLRWAEVEASPGAELLAFHRALLTLRRLEPALAGSSRDQLQVARLAGDLLLVRRRPKPPAERRGANDLLFVIGLLGGGNVDFGAHAVTQGSWELLLDSESQDFGGQRPATLSRSPASVELAGAGAVILRARP